MNRVEYGWVLNIIKELKVYDSSLFDFDLEFFSRLVYNRFI